MYSNLIVAFFYAQLFIEYMFLFFLMFSFLVNDLHYFSLGKKGKMTTLVTCFYYSTLWIWNFWELLYLVVNTDNSLMHIDMKFKINHCFCSTQIWFLSRGKRCWLLSMYSDMDMSKGWYQNGNTSSKIWHDRVPKCHNFAMLLQRWKCIFITKVNSKYYLWALSWERYKCYLALL